MVFRRLGVGGITIKYCVKTYKNCRQENWVYTASVGGFCLFVLFLTFLGSFPASSILKRWWYFKRRLSAVTQHPIYSSISASLGEPDIKDKKTDVGWDEEMCLLRSFSAIWHRNNWSQYAESKAVSKLQRSAAAQMYLQKRNSVEARRGLPV